MVSTKLYTIIYVVLFVFATAQVAVEFMGILDDPSTYWLGFWVIMVLSFVKAAFVAGYYQHLRFEPRSLTYLTLISLVAVLTLTIAASYSIQ